MDAVRLEDLRRRVASDRASIAFSTLAEEYRRTGRYVEAIETCRAGLATHPTFLSARVTLGRALLATEVLRLARLEFEQVLRLSPDNPVALRGLAEIAEREGSPAEAMAFYRRALDATQRAASSSEVLPVFRFASADDGLAEDGSLVGSSDEYDVSVRSREPFAGAARALHNLRQFLEAIQNRRLERALAR